MPVLSTITGKNPLVSYQLPSICTANLWPFGSWLSPRDPIGFPIKKQRGLPTSLVLTIGEFLESRPTHHFLVSSSGSKGGAFSSLQDS